MRRLALAAALLMAASGLAASRGRYGGTLQVAVTADPRGLDPLIADAPSEATILGLWARPICRIDPARGVIGVLAELIRPEANRVRIDLHPELRFGDGAALEARHVAQSWTRVAKNAVPSPYRALLFPLEAQGQAISPDGARGLELKLSFPWPDLEKGLCHPALTVTDRRSGKLDGVGPFRAGPGPLLAHLGFPGGRPYVDALRLVVQDARGAARSLALERAHVALGARGDGTTRPSGPALYATYLAFQPRRVGPELRAALEASLDRADLTRFFVGGSAVPMPRLLPPALHEGGAARPPAPPERIAPAREVQLLFDASREDHRAVAERIQVKLHDRGYRIALIPLDRLSLRRRWAAGEFDLLLLSVLLPPSPAPALAVAIEAAGRHDLLAVHLPPLGAIADPAERARAARERADALQAELGLIPLYAQGLEMAVGGGVMNLALDPQGLPALDAAFLAH